jgi:hypothetical protein
VLGPKYHSPSLASISGSSVKTETPIVQPKVFENAKQPGIGRAVRAGSHNGTGAEGLGLTEAGGGDGPEVGVRGDTDARFYSGAEAQSARGPSCHAEVVAETEVRGDSNLVTVTEPLSDSTACAVSSSSGANTAAALSALKSESDHLASMAQENEFVYGPERSGRRSSMAMELITCGIQFKLDTVVDHSHEAVELAAKLELAMLMLASTETRLGNAMIQIGQLQAQLQQHVNPLQQTETQVSVEARPQKEVPYSTEKDGIAIK